jgi:hypothetical protein
MLRHDAVRIATVQIQGVLNRSGRNQNLVNFVIFVLEITIHTQTKEKLQDELLRFNTSANDVLCD